MENKHTLLQQLKNVNTAYLWWFFLGAHYAYLGNWGKQILYWITLGGLGIWAIIDLFTMKSKIINHNLPILQKLEELE